MKKPHVDIPKTKMDTSTSQSAHVNADGTMHKSADISADTKKSDLLNDDLKRQGVKQPQYSNDPYIEAQMGGVNKGQYEAFLKQTPDQLEKSIKSFDSNIKKHLEYIDNPKSHEPRWDSFDVDRQNNLINHWNNDIARAKEYKYIAENVLSTKLNNK